MLDRNKVCRSAIPTPMRPATQPILALLRGFDQWPGLCLEECMVLGLLAYDAPSATHLPYPVSRRSFGWLRRMGWLEPMAECRAITSTFWTLTDAGRIAVALLYPHPQEGQAQ